MAGIERFQDPPKGSTNPDPVPAPGTPAVNPLPEAGGKKSAQNEHHSSTRSARRTSRARRAKLSDIRLDTEFCRLISAPMAKQLAWRPVLEPVRRE
jgi:hypothetical protein